MRETLNSADRYGLTEEDWEALSEKFGDETLLGLIKALSPYFSRRFYRTRIWRGSETVVIPVERGLGQPTAGIKVNGKDLDLLARAGKKMEAIIEGKGRGIAKSLNEER